MSYKNLILSDNPIAFYQSQNLYAGYMPTYQDIIDNYGTYQEFEEAFPNYKAVFQNVLNDLSPCNNDGGYSGTIDSSNLPLVYGDQYAIRIDSDNYIIASTDNDYTQSISSGGLATKYTSDNDFSIELWMYPSIASTSQVPLLADSTNGMGLFYDNGTIIFDIGSQKVSYTIPYLNKAIHVVAVYTSESILLYIDGVLESYKYLSSFRFTNESVLFKAGPTTGNDYFLINAIAIYRYALSAVSISGHYFAAQSIPAFQVATPDDGTLFDLYDTNIATYYSYSYPGKKPWENLVVPGLKVNTIKNSLELVSGTGDEQEIIIEDVISIPSGLELDDSRIEWSGDNGIQIWTKISEEDTYVQCTNGLSIPQYSLNSFDADRMLYIKIIFSTSDDSLHIPQLSSISISFYNNQIVYARNAGSSINSSTEINLSNGRYPILSRDDRNGLRIPTGSTFTITHDRDVKTMEFFVLPSSIPTSGDFVNLVSFVSGALNTSQSGYPTIYLNGVNVSTSSNISSLLSVNKLAHFVFVYSSALSSDPVFSIPGVYQNICLYDYAFNQAKVLEHYNLWTGTAPVSAADSSMSMTENAISTYNNDWIVVQNV